MASYEEYQHKVWLGMVEPTEGLVVSTPVLVEQQVTPTPQRELHATFKDGLVERDGDVAIADAEVFFRDVLGWRDDAVLRGADIPASLTHRVPEGRQTLVPTLARRVLAGPPNAPSPLLVGVLPLWTPFEVPETVTGDWHYPPQYKFERLLRSVHVSTGVLTNGKVVRLMYAPHSESTGWIDFRVGDMATSDGRVIFDAMVMLLGEERLSGVPEAEQLPAILRASRDRQADVTTQLANQVLDALGILLQGFDQADKRDARAVFEQARRLDDGHTVYRGLLTVLLRLVFILYAEDHKILPVDHPIYQQHMGVLGLWAKLLDDASRFPDTMHQRFGAWSQLLVLFRTLFEGMDHGDLRIPARYGGLFDPSRFRFLEGALDDDGHESTVDARTRRVPPSVDDGTVYSVLERLLVLDGQRLSYKALDVEQIGSVYERLMGYSVVRALTPAVCLKPERVWVEVEDLHGKNTKALEGWLKSEVMLPNRAAGALAKALSEARAAAGSDRDAQDAALLEALGSEQVRGSSPVGPGHVVLQPGTERRRTSSHYTPRTLTGPIVRKTLDPLIACLGDHPTAAQLLNLRICDAAVGSGAFLVEACRYLANHVEAAWVREGVSAAGSGVNAETLGTTDLNLKARRRVAQTCLYGVDKNEMAMELARLSLWLVTLAPDLPFTFVDHAIRHGDSLLGLSVDQIRHFHWKPKRKHRDMFLELLLKDTIESALEERQAIVRVSSDSPQDMAEKRRALARAEDATQRLRLVGDLVLRAFLGAGSDKARNAELLRCEEQVREWLESGGAPPDELRGMQAEFRRESPAFHWELEFPEIFLDPERREVVGSEGVAKFDAFVGNPPFAGKNGITETGGPNYLVWLQTLHAGAHGNADLSAHFFLRVSALLGEHGALGLIATNTIAQGDTRTTGLQTLLGAGMQIFDATENLKWPGEAAVTVSVVHMAKGAPAALPGLSRQLNEVEVEVINSRLKPRPERPDPVKLAANAGLSFQGSIVLGMGFVLTPEERDELVGKDPRNGERIFPYLGGKEVNTSPTHDFHRYVINFGQMSLEEAEAWPDLVAIVREKAKPERDKLKNNADGRRRKQYWWQFGRYTPALFEAVEPLERCLVTSRVSKHLCFSFQPVGRVFAESLYVFIVSDFAHFAVLQSRVHEAWVRLLTSSMKTDLRYAASDCFETFPIPENGDTLALQDVMPHGEQLYAARQAYMIANDLGLTETYNRMKNADCTDGDICELRRLHERVDRGVLDAYGWFDLQVPAYTRENDADDSEAFVSGDRLQAFNEEVVDRLMALNATRAAEEVDG